MRNIQTNRLHRHPVRRLTAFVGATSAALATWAVTGSPAATATTLPAAGSSATATTQSASAAEHVVVLLKDQYANLPASSSSIAARVQATDASQAPLIAKAKHDGGTAIRALHVANAFAVTISTAGAADLAADPAVASVVADRQVAATPAATPAAPAPAKLATPQILAPSRAPASSTVCPSNPSKPLLEPEALQATHTAFSNSSTPSAQQIATGKGVTVAFLADGIDPNNPDFIRADGTHVFTDYQDFSGEGPNAVTGGAEAFGDASSIAAQGRKVYDLSTFVNPAHPLPPGCNIRILGMAPGASLVGLKIFPAGGFAFNSAILGALDWAVTHDHADVINESFGSNQFPDTTDDPTAVFNEELVKSGIVVVASSGDSGFVNSIGSPASAPDVISVGASTTFRTYAQTTENGFQLGNGSYRNNTVSGLSSGGVTQPGRTIDLLAPGDLGWALCSANTDIYVDCTDNAGNPADIQEFGGSSESAPLTAGAAALVIQAYRESHGGASPSALLVKNLLTSTADDLGLPATDQGAGLLDSLRAVRAARAVNAGSGVGGTSDVLSSPEQFDLTTAPGTAAHGDVQVTNLSSHAEVVAAFVRGNGRLLDRSTTDVTLSPLTDPAFVDQLGRTRAFRTHTFNVPAGTANLDADIAWADPNTIVRFALLDPHGVYTAYSIPQGFGDFGEVAVPHPIAGKWTAIIFTAASAAGYSGKVVFTAIDRGTSLGGSTSPSVLIVPAGGIATVHVTVPASNSAGDTADALVLVPIAGLGHAASALASPEVTPSVASPSSDSAAPIGSTSVVPIVVRTLINLNHGSAVFHDQFTGGNGRGTPGPGSTYEFNVPAGSPNLSVGISVAGGSNEAFYAFLVDPNGEAVSTQTNQRTDGLGNITMVPAVQLSHLNPQAGLWELVFTVFGPIAGTSTSTPFTGVISTAANAVHTTGVPNGATLMAGKSVTASVSFTNNGVADGGYFVDARGLTRTDLSLVVQNNPYVFNNDILPPFAAVGVPTQTDSLTVSSTSSIPTLFEISPFPADHVTDLSFEGDPDVEAGPASTTPSVTLTDPVIAPETWLALPASIGPFGDAGSPTVTNTFTATAHTVPFDRAVKASSGDPLLADVDALAPAATPVSVGVGAHGSITLTFKPVGAPGTTVSGVLYLDTWDAVTGCPNEVAAIPYSYTIS